MDKAMTVVLLDLDRTLFDTDRFMADVRQVLQRHYNLDMTEFQARNQHYRVVDDDGMRHYQFFRHIASYGLSTQEVEACLRQQLAGHDYCYPDVADFMAFLEGGAGERLVLTHGESHLQRLKYDCAPPLQTTPFRDILTHKRHYIAQHYSGRQGILIDDAAVGALPAGFSHVQFSRYGAADAYHSLVAVQADWTTLTSNIL